ncbi:Oligopeptide transport ATP-binding protein OppD [Defluviimonas aquaemixtae]|uniref:Oligopeptide transport ATP-binding protein OppD n=1 Tax=Albidovulum aquaemixtae TaxID=1542388 RepID=A0A2R8BK43_9RHOB|nr:ABC transporter ATP-binding protein [Defluviimonas aquaemixtae]SPH23757.1 Oligopeptide transport ATP-binding protein OppD [Defluviimonas aquaemixtae]
MTVLSIRDLSVDFHTEGGTVSALRGVSFDVPENSIVGVVGESGCGKSTLINAILGLLADNGDITSGELIFADGRNLTKLDPDEYRALRGQRIATVFQDPMGALNPVLSIGRQMVNIQYRSGLSPAEKKARAVEMLRKVRIPDAESRLVQYAHEFSGGMKQRIAIAMALMMEPALLIADEPTTALDATLEVATIELLKDLQRDIGCSVLFISHHLGVIAELCDHVIVMYAGEVVERGDIRHVFHGPRHPYTAKLFECDPARLHERVRQLPTIQGEIPDLRARPQGCIFAPRCPIAQPRCAERPPVRDIAPGHQALCWEAAP